MNFQTLGKIEKYQHYLDVAFSNATKTAEKSRSKIRTKDRLRKSQVIEFDRMKSVRKTLTGFMDNIIKSFPRFEDLPDLEGLTAEVTQRILSRSYFSIMKLKFDQESGLQDLSVEDISMLRRLSNTLESRAIFDIQVDERERQSSAFVAAEALSLLASLQEEVLNQEEFPARIEREFVFSRLG